MNDDSSTLPCKGRVLLIEDNEDFALGISMSLRRSQLHATHVTTLGLALERLQTEIFDVILLDLSLPDASGVESVSTVRKAQASAVLIVLTGHNDAELAVTALRLGAQDYLTKPIPTKELLQAIETAIQQTQSRRRLLEPKGARQLMSTHVIGDAPAWQRALDMIHAAAKAPRTTVLVTGEPGVGKEIAVQLIHQLSDRSKHPLVAVNVACLPVSLMESELFGHESGAFTGTSGRKRGFFEQADNGSLFLDEIGELPLELQAKLLRVLEGRPFRRLGGERDLNPNVRLLSATNRPLKQMVADGKFREDLYHRLKVLEIELPPLRKRGGDVEKLALHFLARLGAEMGHTQAYLAPEALSRLREYNWPGNVRELRNVVERALVLSHGDTIMVRHLPKELQESGFYTPTPLPCLLPHNKLGTSWSKIVPGCPVKSKRSESDKNLRLDAAIHRHVTEVLALHDGNISRAAERLGITRQTLRRKLKPPGDKGTIHHKSA